MNELNIRSTNRYFAEDLAEDMARETWTVLLKAVHADSVYLGSFLTVRVAIHQYVRKCVRDISTNGTATRIFAINVGADESDTFGMEAAAAVVCAQEVLFRQVDSVPRVSRAIAKNINTVLAAYCETKSPIIAAQRTRRFRSNLRTVLARELPILAT